MSYLIGCSHSNLGQFTAHSLPFSSDEIRSVQMMSADATATHYLLLQ